MTVPGSVGHIHYPWRILAQQPPICVLIFSAFLTHRCTSTYTRHSRQLCGFWMLYLELSVSASGCDVVGASIGCWEHNHWEYTKLFWAKQHHFWAPKGLFWAIKAIKRPAERSAGDIPENRMGIPRDIFIWGQKVPMGWLWRAESIFLARPLRSNCQSIVIKLMTFPTLVITVDIDVKKSNHAKKN